VSYSLRRAAPCMSIQSWPCGTNDRARLWLSVWRTQLREPRLRNGVSQTDKTRRTCQSGKENSAERLAGPG
jgi:hypothetical protein